MEILDLNLLDSGCNSHITEGEGEKSTPKIPIQQGPMRIAGHMWVICLSIWSQSGAGRKDDVDFWGPPTKLLLSL